MVQALEARGERPLVVIAEKYIDRVGDTDDLGWVVAEGIVVDESDVVFMAIQRLKDRGGDLKELSPGHPFPGMRIPIPLYCRRVHPEYNPFQN